ncbi:MAG: hypothetical protein IPJ41_02810 [Phycisphaerales bacterium]|nr:hypothetical protein [Phycisphaerales bacterium]
MFCGWRLANAYEALEQLGSGTLEIDVLTGESRFNGGAIAELSIAGELHSWFTEDCAKHGIEIDDIASARLTAQLVAARVEAKQRSTPVHHIDTAGKPIRAGSVTRFDIHCEAVIATDGATYTASKQSCEEWPVGWPGS